MRIKDLYCTVLSIVCRVTDLEENEIFCSNKEECVDVRSLLIKTLIDNGITEKEIVRLTGLSQQRVNSLKNNFKYRKRVQFRSFAKHFQTKRWECNKVPFRCF